MLALIGSDYLIARNLIGGLVPATIVVAAGLAAPRAGRLGLAAACALCALCAGAWILGAGEAKFKREDWRSAVTALGPAAGDRVIVATPGWRGDRPLRWYLSGTSPLPPGGARVSEVAVLGMADSRDAPGDVRTPRAGREARPPGSGFQLVGRVDAERFTLLRYRSARPLAVTPGPLQRSRIDEVDAALLLQRGGR